MVHFYSTPHSLRGGGTCRAQGLTLLSDRLCSIFFFVSFGEGVSWIWSRRVGKQYSEGSRVFQLSPAFFSPLPDDSQMFFKAATLSLSICSPFIFLTPLRLFISPLTYSAPSFCLSFQFSLSSGITRITKVLASPCLFVITPCQINSPSLPLFSLFLFSFSLFPSFFLSPSSFVWSDVGKLNTVSSIM